MVPAWRNLAALAAGFGLLVNVAFAYETHLTRPLRRGLRQIQYRPGLVNGCLIQAGLPTGNHTRRLAESLSRRLRALGRSSTSPC